MAKPRAEGPQNLYNTLVRRKGPPISRWAQLSLGAWAQCRMDCAETWAKRCRAPCEATFDVSEFFSAISLIFFVDLLDDFQMI